MPGAQGEQFAYHKTMSSLYYMPGRGGRLDQGLGPHLSERGFDVYGREITANPDRSQSSEFARLPFDQQIEVVAHDLTTLVTQENPWVIGNSFGAYLIAHALLQTPLFNGRCLFLSPVLGPCHAGGMYFRPPKAGQLEKAIERRAFLNTKIDIVTGSLDAQSPVALCERLARNAPGELEVIDGEGHRIDPVHVERVLDRWLST